MKIVPSLPPLGSCQSIMIDLSYFGPHFWIALAEIVGINIMLSSDNAVAVALACRSLPLRQQRWGIALGTAAAVILRIVLTVCIAYLLAIPFLKLAGGAFLFWIAIKLVAPERGDGERSVESTSNLWATIRIIAVADAVMSLDNVIAIAAVASDDLVLIAVGLIVSIPIVIFFSTIIMTFMGRYPIIIWIGGALLGWVAAGVIVSDSAVIPLLGSHAELAGKFGPALGATAVIAAGFIINRVAAAR